MSSINVPYNFTISKLVAEKKIDQPNIEEIKKWLASGTTIPSLSDEMIALFLISCDQDIEKTIRTILAYFRIKNGSPEMFNDRDVDSEGLKTATSTLISASLPVRMENDSVIHFFKLRDTDYKQFDIYQIMKVAYMVIDVSQRTNPPNSLTVLIDSQGIGIRHVMKLKISALKTFMEFLQEAMPLKIKAIHILNATYMFDKAMGLAKAFIKSDLMSIIKTHPVGINYEQFYKQCIPQECLPEEYGGYLPGSEELNKSSIEAYRELKTYFEAEENLRKSYLPNKCSQ